MAKSFFKTAWTGNATGAALRHVGNGNGGVFTAVGDFNGDGRDDIAMSLNWENGRTTTDVQTNAAPQSVYLSHGGGLTKVDLDFRIWAHGFAAGDLNMDGREDFIVGGFTLDPAHPEGSGSAAFIQNADGTLTRQWIGDLGGSFAAIADFDQDGLAEIIDVIAGLRVTQLDAQGKIVSQQVFPDPYERLQDGLAWNGPTTFKIMKDGAGREYIGDSLGEHQVVDINEDGRPDLAGVWSGSALAYNSDGVLIPGATTATIAFYTMDDAGVMQLLPSTFSGWEEPAFALPPVTYLDFNGDGHLDVFIGWQFGAPGQNGPRIYLNDGDMHFTRIKQSLLPHVDGSSQTVTALDANKDGLWDLYFHIDGYDLATQPKPTPSDVVMLGTTRFYTGPGYTNPALKGAAGFNEQYYLHTYADAAAAVKSGKYKTGLDHYLDKGKAKGYFGFAENTHIYGADGKDTIKARAGNEWLDGGLGNDTLSGKAGADTFVFSTRLGPANVDTIKDFKHDVDVIALDDAIFRKIGAALDGGEFYAKKGAVEAHDKDDRIIYDTRSGKLYYDDDGNKKAGHDAIHFATLSPKLALDAGDFIIV